MMDVMLKDERRLLPPLSEWGLLTLETWGGVSPVHAGLTCPRLSCSTPLACRSLRAQGGLGRIVLFELGR